MTSEEHNKVLGICHLAYGGLMTLMMLAVFIFMWMIVLSARPGVPNSGLPAAFIGLYFGFILIYTLVLTVPSFVAGYAMLKRKNWARMASLVAAVFELMSFPFGTPVGIYSFWFMLSEGGKSLYGVPAAPTVARPYSLHDAPPQPASDWNAQTSFGREREYAPPAQPPDWRGQ